MSSYMPPSKSDTHLTPDVVFDLIKNYWGKTKDEFFDPCPENYTQNGLQIHWKKLNFVNPPYTLLKQFVSKAILESELGNQTIMLLPSKTDQKWFHLLIQMGYEIRWIQGRLKFKNNKWSATQPHFLVYVN